MRHAESVSGDRHAAPRTLTPVASNRRRAERGRLERAPDVTRGDGAGERRQRVVPRSLVARVLVERQAAVLPRRQNRPRGCGVVGLRGCLERREHDRRRCDERRGKRGEAAKHARDGTALATQYSPLVDALLAFAATLIALRLSGDLVRRYRAATEARARSLGCRSGRICARGGRPRMGCGCRVERGSVPPVLPRRRLAHGRAPRRWVAPPRAPPLGDAGRARVCRARDRRCGRRAVADRALRLRDPGGAGRSRALARTDPRDRRKLTRNARRRRRRTLDVPLAAARQRVDPRGDRGGSGSEAAWPGSASER